MNTTTTTTTTLRTVPEVYEGHALTFLELDGKPMVLAREVGRALGYANDGKSFLNSIAEWTDDLREGEHVVKVEGERLAWLKERLVTETVTSRAPSLLLLTERGLLRACMLAGGPVAVRFRDWAEGVLLQVMKGETAKPAEDPTVAKSRELRLLAGRAERQGDRERAKGLIRAAADLFLGPEPEPPAVPPAPSAGPDVCGPLFAAWVKAGGQDMTVTQVVAWADERGLLVEETRGSTQTARITRLGILLRARVGVVVEGRRLVLRRPGNTRHYVFVPDAAGR